VNRTPILTKAMVTVLLLWSFVPMLREELGYMRLCYTNVRGYQIHKSSWESFASTISGRRLLSTMSDVAVLSGNPEIPDPFLNASLERSGGWNSGPIADQIGAGVYDLVVIRKGEAEKDKDDGYRGIRKWSDEMWGALKRTYEPVCVFPDDRDVEEEEASEGNDEVWLPRRGAGEILPKLLAIGCVPETKQLHNGSAARSPAQ
jgi:hypothetical protein